MQSSAPRLIALLAGFGLAGARASAMQEPEAPPRRPNILLVVTDDQSWCHAGAYGCAAVDTPRFDHLARNGVRFTNAFAPSSTCTPSRSAILTGQEVWRLGEGAQFGRTLPGDLRVFPRLLEEAGYFVGWTGKGWGPGDLAPGGWERNPLGTPFNEHLVSPRRGGREFFSIDYKRNFRAFLRARPAHTPFFFWCGTTQPHRPYPEGSLQSGKRLEDVSLPAHLPDTEDVRRDFLDYFVQIEYLDRHLGAMVAQLDQLGELEHTLIVVTSDNGMSIARGKGTLYDLGTRVPLVVSWPGRIPPGRTIDDLAGLTDLAPTFLEAAGLPVPSEMTGRSLLSVLLSEEEGRVDPERTRVFLALENFRPMRAIRTYDHLYVQNFPSRVRRGETGPGDDDTGDETEDPEESSERPPEELYDLRLDPGQVTDVASDPAHAADLARLREELDAYRTLTGDPRIRGEDPFGTPVIDGGDRWRLAMFGKVWLTGRSPAFQRPRREH